MDNKYAIPFAYTILIAALMAINQQALAQNQTYKSYYGNILQFCFDRVEKILAGYNPLKDLVKANLIPRHFENMTCADISNEALGNTTSTFSKLEH